MSNVSREVEAGARRQESGHDALRPRGAAAVSGPPGSGDGHVRSRGLGRQRVVGLGRVGAGRHVGRLRPGHRVGGDAGHVRHDRADGVGGSGISSVGSMPVALPGGSGGEASRAAPGTVAPVAARRMEVEVDGRRLSLSNLDKVFYPETGSPRAR